MPRSPRPPHNIHPPGSLRRPRHMQVYISSGDGLHARRVERGRYGHVRPWLHGAVLILILDSMLGALSTHVRLFSASRMRTGGWVIEALSLRSTELVAWFWRVVLVVPPAPAA